MSKMDAHVCVEAGENEWMNEWTWDYLCYKVYISSVTQCMAKNNLSFHTDYTAQPIALLIMPNSKFKWF